MSRSKPYSTNQETWNNILQKPLTIPMEQREYSWDNDQVRKFLIDLINIFKDGVYVEKMGSIINLTYNGSNAIYDGQQRILTTILILNVIGIFCEKIRPKILALLTIDNDIDKMTNEQEDIKNEFKVEIMPKIYCVSPHDMQALVEIFNNKINFWIDYVKNPTITHIAPCYDDEILYSCKYCDSKLKDKRTFITHIFNKHKYHLKDNSQLYMSFVEIYNYFKINNFKELELIDLYKFIMNDIDIQFYSCNDSTYACKMWLWENNCGVTVKPLDIVKGPILSKIPREHRKTIYDKWETLKNQSNKIYKNFGEKVFNIAIQLLHNNIVMETDNEDLFKIIIDSQDSYKEINNFFEIVEKLFSIMKDISDDKFGRLINTSTRVCLNWDAYKSCLLPIFYKTEYIDKKLIKLFTKWFFRNLQFKNRTFNNLCYLNEFIKITNNVLKNTNNQYYNEIENNLTKNKDNSINNTNYITNMKEMSFKSSNATYILLYLETCMNTNIHVVSLKFTCEHIIPQKDKDNLKKCSLINNIGNLTLIEGKNSDNGHKGNSSLGSKPYNIKKESYSESSSKITRDIPTKFQTFNEESIKERGISMIELLDEYTEY